MERLKKLIINVYKSSYFPFVIFFISMLVIHKAMNVFGDDNFFKTVAHGIGTKDYLIDRYNNWSSRVVVEGIMINLLQLRYGIWKLMNCVVMLVLSLSISNILGWSKERECNWGIVFFMWTYSFMDMSTAGWVATMMNYLWPLAFGILTIVGVKRSIKSVKISMMEYVIYIIATIYATNVEQMCIILLPLYLISLIYVINKKKFRAFLLIENIIGISNLILILVSPGNANRNILENGTWCGDFEMLTFIDKIRLGFMDTITSYIAMPNLVFVITSGLMFVYVWNVYKERYYRLIAVIPFLMSSLFGCFGSITRNLFPSLGNLIRNFREDNIPAALDITIDNFNLISSYIPIIVYMTIITAFAIGIYLIFKGSLKTVILLLLLFLGLGSRMALGFSPTMYASNTRTYVFLDFSFILVGLCIYKEVRTILTLRKKDLLFNTIGIIGVLSYINVLIDTAQKGI